MSIPLQNISGNSNCSGLTTEEVTAVTLSGSIIAASFSISWLLVLVALLVCAKCYYWRIWGTTVRRLVIGLTMYTAVYELTLSLQLVHTFHPEWDRFCEAQGFVFQYFGSVELLFIATVCLVLFFEALKVITSSRLVEYYEKAKESMSICCGWRIKKLEVIIYASLFGLPIIFDLIPFTTNSYGTFGPWCWIHNIGNDCSPHGAGLWEQVWLLMIPFGVVILLALVLFTTLMCLVYGMKSPRIALIEVVVIVSVFVLAVVLITWCPLVIYKRSSFIVWMLVAISTPSAAALVPLVLLIGIHLPISSILSHARCKHQVPIHGEGNLQATLHVSSEGIKQPSHTTWNPLHSSNEHSEIVPMVRGHQHQQYGSSA